MTRKSVYFLTFLLLIILSSCGRQDQIAGKFSERSKEIGKKYAPDKSLNLFTARLTYGDSKWVLRGETTVPAAKAELVSWADSVIGDEKYLDSLRVLPDTDLGDNIYGIINVSVANMRDHPRHSAQMVNQCIMGKAVHLLKKDGGWFLVQTDYGYLGWMTEDSFLRTDQNGKEEWESSKKVKVKELFTMIRSQPEDNAEPVTDVVLNARLKPGKILGKWMEVSTPDGREGYLPHRMVSDEAGEKLSGDKLRSKIVFTARSMMGIPYLWGGNSPKGNDCSGFTRTVFEANGIYLPRDARQQVFSGEEVVPDENFSNVLPGDLLFFGSKERITHVGISLGGTEFIHQSGWVHVASLNPGSSVYSPSRKSGLQKIKRIFK